MGAQYLKERFAERIAKLVNNVSTSLVARNENGLIVGGGKANDVMQYNHIEWTEFTVQ